MRTVGATFATILASPHQEALGVTLGTVKALVAWPTALTTANAGTLAPGFFLLSDLQTSNPSTMSVSVTFRDADGTLAAMDQEHRLLEVALKVHLLASADGTTWYSETLFDGEVERVPKSVEGFVALKGGPKSKGWLRQAPELFGPTCSWVGTAECSEWPSCLHSWPACQAKARTADFGGFRFIRPAGTVIEFRDGTSTLGPDPSGGGGKGVVYTGGL